MEVFADNLGGFIRGKSDVAIELTVDAVQHGAGGIFAAGVVSSGGFGDGLFHVEQIVLPESEVGDRFVARLNFGLGEVDGLPQEAGWGAGLEAAEFQSSFLE